MPTLPPIERANKNALIWQKVKKAASRVPEWARDTSSSQDAHKPKAEKKTANK